MSRSRRKARYQQQQIAVKPSDLQLNLRKVEESNGVKVEPLHGAKGTGVPHVITFSSNFGMLGRVYRNPDEAIRHSRENARIMLNDLAVAECVEARQRMVALLPWHLETDDPKNETHKQLVDALTKIVERIHRFTEYRRNVQEAIWYGRMGMQHNYAPTIIQGRKCYTIAPSKNCMGWYPINGDKLCFSQDSNEVALRIGMAFMGEEYFIDDRGAKRRIELYEENPGKLRQSQTDVVTEYNRVYWLSSDERRRMLIHKHMITDAAFEDGLSAGAVHGVGIRSRIYWTWFQKQNTLANLMEYLERSAMGFEIWTYPWGNPEGYENVKTAAISRVGGAKNVVFVPRIPGQEDLYSYEHIEPGLAGINAINELVHQFFNWQIKRYILGQILSSEPEGGGLGSSGISDFQSNTLRDIIKYDACNLEDTFTDELLPELIRVNRNVLPIGSESIRVKFMIDTESDKNEEKLGAIEKAVGMGLKVKADSLYDILGLEKPAEGDEILGASNGGEQFGGMPGGDPQGAIPGVGQAPQRQGNIPSGDARGRPPQIR